MRPGDVIVKLADHEIADSAGLRNLTAGLDVGSRVSLTFYRDGKPVTSRCHNRRSFPPAPEVLVVLRVQRP